jgi:hypothetical protein
VSRIASVSCLSGGEHGLVPAGISVQFWMIGAKPRLLPPTFMTSASIRRDAAGSDAR